MSEPEYVTFVLYPPKLDRQDWLATLKGYKAGDPMGYGSTEHEAMQYLVRLLGKKDVTETSDEKL